MRYPPERIVCLTEETVETLYLIGEQDPHRWHVGLCSELSTRKAATERIVSPDAVIATRPDVILASWCGEEGSPRAHRRALRLGRHPRSRQ